MTELPLASIAPGLLPSLVHPLVLKTGTTQPDRFLLETWATSWMLPVMKSPWLRVVPELKANIFAPSSTAKAVPRCMLTIKWHGGSQATAWTINWSLASCLRNSPSVPVSHLTESLHILGYNLNFCGKNTKSNTEIRLHPIHGENGILGKKKKFVWANVLSCLSAIPFQVVGRRSVAFIWKDKPFSYYISFSHFTITKVISEVQIST